MNVIRRIRRRLNQLPFRRIYNTVTIGVTLKKKYRSHRQYITSPDKRRHQHHTHRTQEKSCFHRFFLYACSASCFSKKLGIIHKLSDAV